MAYAKTSAVCIAQAVWQKILITYLVYWDASRIIKLIEWNVDAKSEWTGNNTLFTACAHNYVSRQTVYRWMVVLHNNKSNKKNIVGHWLECIYSLPKQDFD